MTPATALLVVIAFVALILALASIMRTFQLVERLLDLALSDRAAREEERCAEVREITTGPHLRLVVNNVGDEVERDVFPRSAA